jgi:hypothetical protein
VFNSTEVKSEVLRTSALLEELSEDTMWDVTPHSLVDMQILKPTVCIIGVSE